MPKFPQLLILFTIAFQARVAFGLGTPGSAQATGRSPTHLISLDSKASIVAIPEPGVFVALISGAAMLVARRRRR